MNRLMSLATWCVLFGFLLLQAGGVAMAQSPSQAQANAIRQSCRSDYQSYCSSVPTGGRASLQCLQSHLGELSPPCQSAVSSAAGGASGNPPVASGQPMPPAAGGGSMPPAAGSPMSPREKMAMMRRSCGGDFRAYCRGVPLGGGEVMKCLAANESRLSPACRDVLAEAHGPR